MISCSGCVTEVIADLLGRPRMSRLYNYLKVGLLVTILALLARSTTSGPITSPSSSTSSA
jgi:hypothetical protein